MTNKSPAKLVDPLRVFIHAVHLENASHLIGKAMQGQLYVDLAFPQLVVPHTVMTAFTCEVYLKCLYAIEHGGALPPNRVHELADLFALLSTFTQAKIEEVWNDWESKNPHTSPEVEKIMQKRLGSDFRFTKDFRTALKDGSSAFVEWRYLYEGKMTDGSWALSNFHGVLRETIISLRPEWKDKTHVRPIEMHENSPFIVR